MLRNYYINKEWILSATVRRIYRIAAVLSLMLFVSMWMALQGVPDAFRPLLRISLRLGIVGAATTMVAMEYFLFGFDKSSEWKKVFWFCVLALPLFGPALYCFIVYSRSTALRAPGDGTGSIPSTAKPRS